MKIKKIIFALLLPGFLASCSFLEPLDDNHTTETRVLEDATYAETIFLNGYATIPTFENGNDYGWSFSDLATDDAVSNDKQNEFLKMASGQWTAANSPVSHWNHTLRGVLFMNQFLDKIVNTIKWSDDPTASELFRWRFKGEAFAIRGILRYYALLDVAGKSSSGEMLGIPIFNEFQEQDADFNIPRSTFAESVKAIENDFDSASVYLPYVYKNISNISLAEDKFNWVNKDQYNLVLGDNARQRVQRRIIRCFQGKLALLAASPSYNPDATSVDDPMWLKAAQLNADALENVQLSSNGHLFYTASNTNSAPLEDNNDNEIAWRSANDRLKNTLEKRVFPPSLNGKGDINPSQNLVDAFPMVNGYPITDLRGGYDASNPYVNRDPRFGNYVIYNGLTFKGNLILTHEGAGVDAKDALSTSTRTGYYLRKLIREDVTFNNDGSSNTQKHFQVHVRYTEVFLNYAEAANEVGGPDYIVPGFSMSARDVIGQIRNRAGIEKPDAFLQSISSQENMRQLIRNERRLELCFEGFRFHDIRRWGLEMNVPARGVQINSDGGSYTYESNTVDERNFQPYMIYAPVPASEVLKYSALQQNQGWN